MAIKVTKVTLWRKEVDNRPGVLFETLEPLAKSNLRVVMGYGIPEQPTRAVVELFPISGKSATRAAEQAGLRPSEIPCVLAEGDDRPGLGRDMARNIADQGINIHFLMAETIGRRFSAVFGFGNDADAKKAMAAIKTAARRKK